MKKKNIIKAMCFWVLISSVLSIETVAKTKSPRSIPGTAIFVMSEVPSVVIQTKKMFVNTPTIKISIDVPQFMGLNDKHFEMALNKRLIKEAKTHKEIFIKEAKTYEKDLAQDALNGIAFEYIENFTPIQAPEPYLVVEQFMYQYSGGAHGLSNYRYLIIDTLHSKEVRLKDLFKENVDYQNILSAKIKEMIRIKEAQGAFFFSGSDGFQRIREDQPFFIDKNGDFVVVFNIYEIAPYAAGTQFFVIPRASLLPYLK